MTNKTTRTYILPSGAEIEVEGPKDRQVGASDVCLAGDVKIRFEEVVAPLGEVAELLFSKIKSSIKEPDEISLEFAASLKGKTWLLAFSGEGQGSVKVSLTWKKSGNT